MERRDLLKFFPLAPLAFRDGDKIVSTQPSVAQADKALRTIFCFRLTVSLPPERIDIIRTTAREMLDQAGFKDALSFVLPIGVELDVFCVPKE